MAPPTGSSPGPVRRLDAALSAQRAVRATSTRSAQALTHAIAAAMAELAALMETRRAARRRTFSASSSRCWRTMRCRAPALDGDRRRSACRTTAWAAALDGEIAGLRGLRRRIFPRPRGGSPRHARPRAAASRRRRPRQAAGGAAVLVRRGHARRPAFSRPTGAQGGAIALSARQHHQPCGHAGAGARHSHGGRTWRRRDPDGRRRGHRRWRQRHCCSLDPDAAMAERLSQPAPRRSMPRDRRSDSSCLRSPPRRRTATPDRGH